MVRIIILQGKNAEDNPQITLNQSCLVTATLLVFVHRKKRHPCCGDASVYVEVEEMMKKPHTVSVNDQKHMISVA